MGKSSVQKRTKPQRNVWNLNIFSLYPTLREPSLKEIQYNLTRMTLWHLSNAFQYINCYIKFSFYKIFSPFIIMYYIECWKKAADLHLNLWFSKIIKKTSIANKRFWRFGKIDSIIFRKFNKSSLIWQLLKCSYKWQLYTHIFCFSYWT